MKEPKTQGIESLQGAGRAVRGPRPAGVLFELHVSDWWLMEPSYYGWDERVPSICKWFQSIVATISVCDSVKVKLLSSECQRGHLSVELLAPWFVNILNTRAAQLFLVIKWHCILYRNLSEHYANQYGLLNHNIDTRKNISGLVWHSWQTSKQDHFATDLWHMGQDRLLNE